MSEKRACKMVKNELSPYFEIPLEMSCFELPIKDKYCELKDRYMQWSGPGCSKLKIVSKDFVKISNVNILNMLIFLSKKFKKLLSFFNKKFLCIWL